MENRGRELKRILAHVKGLIASEGVWCQGQLAMGYDGVPLTPSLLDEDPNLACKLCVQGAVRVVTRGKDFEWITDQLDAAAEEIYPPDHEVWKYLAEQTAGEHPHVAVNDHLGFEAVHAMLDYAIEEAEAP